MFSLRSICPFLGFFFLEGAAKNGVHSFLCVSDDVNDEAVVLLQLGDPVLDVGAGVATGVFVGDARDGREEGRADFGNQLFFVVKLVCEAVAKGAIQKVFMSGAVDGFMKGAL